MPPLKTYNVYYFVKVTAYLVTQMTFNLEMKDGLVNYHTSLEEIEFNLKVIISVKIAVISFPLNANGLFGSKVVFGNKYSCTFQGLCYVDYLLPSVGSDVAPVTQIV